MFRAGIRVGKDRDAADAQPLGRLHDAAGDFAAIGYEDRVEHGAGPLSGGERGASPRTPGVFEAR
ncbi:hypothetical protein ACFOHS_05820 [Jhaorihella thermophila]